ncbi:tryptophan 7-halogenase [Nocardia sp. CDC153]|uniref:tryptophan 7-halogenase n=1 Tax=Nocardia sp. CDC153 TaxID=3112167 RepID=UPI002DBBB9A3|nr:tryptophan 7-halogenase [Nocardia sp. CDC153]MEC3957768.1 tryptophan 7-halogenase [Nocardia sp. CDC153]
MTEAVRQQLSELSDEQKAALAEVLRARQASRPAEPGHYDVVILGGGMAGLTLSLQLRRTQPDIRVIVIENQPHPVPEAAHKVGESTVEISAHYLRDILGLKDHLDNGQLRKFGLRFFFTGGDNSDITRRVEVGTSVWLPLDTYQLDRGRLENEIGRRCAAAGVEFISGCKVTDVDLRPEEPLHRVRIKTPEGQRDVAGRWVVDASGRTQVLRRRLGRQRIPVAHTANASWFRVAHRIDIDTWSDDPEWTRRTAEGKRYHSTNHLMGPGYWLWLIPLASGSTSVGIVCDDDLHNFDTFNKLDKALEWIRKFEPEAAAQIDQHLDKIQDFRVMRDYCYSAEQVYAGDQRWALTGEAGLFLDPLYSPGLDLISISNGLTSDLILRSLAGEDVTALAAIHDSLYRNVADFWRSIYEKRYPLMGSARIMSSKVVWDTAFYWGVFGLLFFHDKFRTISANPSVAANLGRLTQISNRMQQFFTEWQTIDGPPLDPQYIDTHVPLNFMDRLHRGMADDLTPAEFETRFSANTRLFAQLAGQLISTVIEAHADNYTDEVVDRIQQWRRDPLITDFLSIYRKDRHKNPTSPLWITMGGPSKPDENPVPSTEDIDSAVR